jgi:hypothetical protein
MKISKFQIQKLSTLISYILKEMNKEYSVNINVITHILFLCDWKHSIEYKKIITGIAWEKTNYGVIDRHSIIDNIFLKDYIYRNNYDTIQLSSDYITTIQFILEKTKKFKYTDFLHLVYSTYPMIMAEKNKPLNLISLANEYNIYKEKEKNATIKSNTYITIFRNCYNLSQKLYGWISKRFYS